MLCPKHQLEIEIDSACVQCVIENPADNRPERTITHVLPSLHFKTAVVIILSKCHHRHVRPDNAGHKVGDTFRCCLCIH